MVQKFKYKKPLTSNGNSAILTNILTQAWGDSVKEYKNIRFQKF